MLRRQPPARALLRHGTTHPPVASHRAQYGQGDLRATTRQAFQLHGVTKGNLKQVIADIANCGSNTYGGCGDINRNIMAPAVHFPNNPAYMYCMKYSRAIADLFKPMTEVRTTALDRTRLV